MLRNIIQIISPFIMEKIFRINLHKGRRLIKHEDETRGNIMFGFALISVEVSFIEKIQYITLGHITYTE